MREIKFRAWDDYEKRMYHDIITGGPAIILEYDDFEEDEATDFKLRMWCSKNLNEIHVMQFTGLHDKKGTEIYEGDIVKAFSPGVDDEEGNNEVIFVDGCFKLSKTGVDNFPLGSYRRSEVEVIGNIYVKAGGAE